MSPPMSPRLPGPAANDVVRQVALARGLQVKLPALFPGAGSPAETLAAAWNALLFAGVAQVDEASRAETILPAMVLHVDVEVVSDDEVVVIANRRRIAVTVDDEFMRMTLWQAFDSLQTLVGE
jgi:hypothetical protein